MRCLGLVYYDGDARARAAAAALRAWCAAHNCEVRGLCGADGAVSAAGEEPRADLPALDLVVALGGDGTILRAVHLMERAGVLDVPVLGVKFGRLGFLSGAPADQLLVAVAAALDGQATSEARALLDVRVWAGAQLRGRYRALNEVLVGRQAGGGIVTTRLVINGHTIYTQVGDGLIAATATGSTAYALAAGGPIMSPGYDGMVLVALASHTLVNRALVTAPQDTVRIELPDPTRAAAMVAIDGLAVVGDGGVSAGVGAGVTAAGAAVAADADTGSGERLTHIEVSMSERTVALVKMDTRLFFDTLSQEFFGGGADRRIGSSSASGDTSDTNDTPDTPGAKG